jgi:hypothetical protein
VTDCERSAGQIPHHVDVAFYSRSAAKKRSDSPEPSFVDTAAANFAEVQVPIGARMIGTSMPKRSQRVVLSICNLLLPGGELRIVRGFKPLVVVATRSPVFQCFCFLLLPRRLCNHWRTGSTRTRYAMPAVQAPTNTRLISSKVVMAADYRVRKSSTAALSGPRRDGQIVIVAKSPPRRGPCRTNGEDRAHPLQPM